MPGDTNGTHDVFVRDRQMGTTRRMSRGPGGVQGNLDSVDPAISADGRFVAFESFATNLVPGDTNGGPTCSSGSWRPEAAPTPGVAGSQCVVSRPSR